MKILFTGGGTGGHIVPILGIARELRKIKEEKDLQFFYIGPKDEFNNLLLSQEGIAVLGVFAGKLRRYFSVQAILQNIADVLFKIPAGIVQAFFKLLFLNPDIVLSKGGYGALPATIAAKILGIPIFLHESDSISGASNQLAANFALTIFTSFPHTAKLPLEKSLLIGNPIRTDLLTGSKDEAKTLFHLTGGKPLVLILGGSQGSQKINDTVLAILNDLLQTFEIIHQTGEKNYAEVAAEAKAVMEKSNEPFYHPSPFLRETELRHAFAAASLIVNRSGAGSIFETAALGKPAILIPLTGSAQNHQIENAYAYAKTGAAIVLEESNLSPHFFLEKMRALIENPKEMAAMSQAALTFARPNAARDIAQYLIEYLKKE